MSKFNNNGKLISLEGVSAETVISVIDSSISIDGNFLSKEHKTIDKGNEARTKLSSLLLLDSKQQTSESELIGVKCGIPSNISDNIGREEELETIEKLLTNQRFVVICGMAGVGKTLTALNFVHKWVPKKFHTALLINMDNEDTIRDSLHSFLSYINIKPNSTILENIKIIYTFFASHDLLVILDNIVNRNEPFHYLWSEAENRNVFILGTSQDEQFVHRFIPVKLTILSVDNSIKLLRRELGVCGAQFEIDNSESIPELVTILGYHPLAINLSAAIIVDIYTNENNKYSISDYVREHNTKIENHLPIDFGKKTIHVAIKTNIERIKRTKNGAYELLCFMSLMDPTDINTKIFDIASEFAEFKNVEAALNDLKRYSIVQIHENVIQIHRLFQLINQKMLMDNDQFELYKNLVFRTLMLCGMSEINVVVHYKYVMQFFTNEEEIRKSYELAFDFGILKDKLESDLEVINSLDATCCSSKGIKVDNWKAWHYAAYSADGEVAKKLIALDVSILSATQHGWSVLHSIVMNTKYACKSFLNEEILQNLKLIPKKIVNDAISLFKKIIKKLSTFKIHVLNMEIFLQLGGKQDWRKFYIPIIKKRKNEMNDSFLLAALGGFDEVVQLFIDAEYDLNIKKHNTTPLRIAVVNGNLTTVKKLVDAGADVNLYNDDNSNPVFAAVFNDNIDIVRYLTEHINFDIKKTYTNLNLSLLQSAVMAGHVDIIKHVFHILKANNDENISEKDHIQEAGPNGMNLLHLAAFLGNINVIKYFTNFNVNFNLKDDCGCTAFIWAIFNRHLHLVKYLTLLEMDKSDSYLEQKIIDSYTPLLAAVEAGDVKIVEFFVDHNANFLQKADNGNGMLHIAAIEGHLDVIIYITTSKKIIQNISNLIQKNNYGNTPLHSACLQGHINVVKYLIDFYVNLKKEDASEENDISFVLEKNSNGHTALDLAVHYGHLNVVEYMSKLYLKSFIYSMDDDEWTPLHSAVDRGHLNVVKFIITFEHDKNRDFSLKSLLEQKNVHGNTPIHQASLKGHLDVIKYLIDTVTRTNASLNLILEEKNKKEQTPLLLSVFNGHYETVKYLIGFYRNLNHISENGFSTLHIAAQEGHLEIIKCLVDSENAKKEGNDSKSVVKTWLQQKTTFGDTPLHSASKRGHVSIVEYFGSVLDDAKTEIFGLKNNSGYTPRHHAALFGHLDVVKYIDLFMDPHYSDYNNHGYTAFHSTASEGYIDVVKYFISTRDTNEVQQFLYQTNNDGNSAVHLAAFRGHESVIKYIFQYSLKYLQRIHFTSSCLEQTNVKGATPLMMAAAGGCVNIIIYLVELNANIHHTTMEGLTPLFMAADRGHLDVIKYFISLIQDESSTQSYINAKTNKDQTALHFATYKGHLNVVEYLISLNVDVGTVLVDGFTVLHTAALAGHLNIIKYFIDLGLNLNAEDNEGRTPLFSAAYNGHVHVVEYISLKGNYKKIDKYGFTPLHLAVQNDHLTVIKFLIDMENKRNPENFSCYINQKTNSGLTPVNVAALNGHLRVVEYLVNINSDFYQTDVDGYAPIHSATLHGYIDVVKYLVSLVNDRRHVKDGDLSLKSYLEQKTAEGNTILHIGAMEGHFDIFKYIVNSLSVVLDASSSLKIYLNEKNNEGFTPLSCAVYSGRLEIIEFIVSIFNNNEIVEMLFEKNILGNAPLHEAVRKYRLDIIKYIIEFICNVKEKENAKDFILQLFLEQKNKNGYNPLHLAALHNCVSVIKYIISFYANKYTTCDEGFTSLHLASQEGHLDIVKFIVDFEVQKNDGNPLAYLLRKTNIGNTPLHEAARNGQLNVIDFFVNFIYDSETCNEDISLLKLHLFQENNDGFTPLELATIGEYLDVINYIINIPNELNNSHLEPLLEFHLEHKNIFGNTIVHSAIISGKINVVRYFVDVINKTEYNLQQYLQMKNNVGSTMIHQAAYNGDVNIVKYIIDAYSNFDPLSSRESLKTYLEQGNSEENSCLHIAAMAGQVHVFKYFVSLINALQNDTNTTMLESFFQQKNICGHTVLHSSVSSGQLEMVQCIVNISSHLDKSGFFLKTYFNQKDNDENTLLLLAAFNGSLDILKYMIDSEININKGTDNTFKKYLFYTNKNKCTLLHAATFGGSLHVIEYIVSQYLDLLENEEFPTLVSYIDQVNFLGITALHLAAELGHLEIIDYFVSLNADVLQKANDGSTILHFAASKGHINIVKYFIDLFRSDEFVLSTYVEQKNNFGFTAREIACLNGKVDVMEYLTNFQKSDGQ